MANKTIYRVVFHNQGKIYEIYAARVVQGDMLGFIEVEDLLFGEKTALVVDPSEERLKAEFEGVRRFQLPMHSVIRIDEVEKRGTAKIVAAEGNVTPLPTSFYTPPKGGS